MERIMSRNRDIYGSFFLASILIWVECPTFNTLLWCPKEEIKEKVVTPPCNLEGGLFMQGLCMSCGIIFSWRSATGGMEYHFFKSALIVYDKWTRLLNDCNINMWSALHLAGGNSGYKIPVSLCWIVILVFYFFHNLLSQFLLSTFQITLLTLST